MDRIRVVFAVMVWCFCLNSGWRVAADESVPRKLVDELIQQLNASTLIDRSRAERRLVELGPDILPLLPPPDLIEGVSAKEAVRRIRPQLERRAAKDSSTPSHVTIRGEHSIGEIIQQIQLQTKNRVSLADDDRETLRKRLNLDWDQILFWESLDRLCDGGGLQWQFDKSEPIVRISRTIERRSQIVSPQSTGPFRLVIVNASQRPVVGDESQRIIRVTGRLAIEPRLRPLFLSMAAIDLKAVTDDDRSLSPWNPDAKYEFPVSDGGREVPIQWDFRIPASMSLKSLSIRGRCECQIAAATERIVFDQTSQTRGAIRRRGGVTVRLRGVTFEPVDSQKLNADIGITVSYDQGGPAFESHRSWMFHNAVYLETKSGTKSNFTDFETSQQADGAIAIDYRWRKIDGPASQYSLIYEAPTLIVNLPIDVDVKGILLTDDSL